MKREVCFIFLCKNFHCGSQSVFRAILPLFHIRSGSVIISTEEFIIASNGCLYDFSREGTRRVPLLPDPVLDGGMEVVESEDLEEEPTLVDDDGASVFGGITRVAHEPKQGLALFIQTGDVDLTVPVPSQGLMVGRLATNDIVLHSRAVSKRHVFVIPCGWTLLVQDQGATNPAILKGQEVTGGQTMCLGDTLNICGSLLTLVEGKAAVSDAT